MSDFNYEIGSDNIAVIKWDVPNKKFNVLTIGGINEIENILDELFKNNDLKLSQEDLVYYKGSL